MSTKKPISKQTTTESLEIQPLTEPVITQEALERLATEIQVSAKKRKHGKTKVVRDSFSFPKLDHLKLLELKKICLAAGIPVKKGELLRAGLQLLTKLSLAELQQVVEQVEKVKPIQAKS